jgi:hypothetical protein
MFPPPPPSLDGKNGCEDDEFELVDVHKLIQEKGINSLHLLPGLTNWKVPLLVNQSKAWGPKTEPNWLEAYKQQQEAQQGEHSTSSSSVDRSSWWAEDLEIYHSRRHKSEPPSSSSSASSSSNNNNADGWLPTGIKRSMFPPIGDYANIGKELTKCARVLPSKQDGGGFFVALIRRKEVAPKPAMSSDQHNNDNNNNSSINAAAASTEPLVSTLSSMNMASPPSEVLLTSQGSLFDSIVSFYGLSTDLFPSFTTDDADACPSLVVEGHRVVLTSHQLTKFVTQTLHQSQLSQLEKLSFKVHSFGLRVFLQLQPSQIRACKLCRWRPCQEGIGWLAANSTKRKLFVHVDLMMSLLKHRVMSYEFLQDMSEKGYLAGYEDILMNDSEAGSGGGGGSVGVGETPSPLRPIEAGGLLIGVIGSSITTASHINSAATIVDNHVDTSFIWIACLATTKSVHVYADENSLFGIRELLASYQAKNNISDTTHNTSPFEYFETLFEKYKLSPAVQEDEDLVMKPEDEEV